MYYYSTVTSKISNNVIFTNRIFICILSHENKKAPIPFREESKCMTPIGCLTFIFYQKHFLWQNRSKASLSSCDNIYYIKPKYNSVSYFLLLLGNKQNYCSQYKDVKFWGKTFFSTFGASFIKSRLLYYLQVIPY